MKTPEQKIQQRDRMRELRKDPKFKAAEAEKRHAYTKTPEAKAKRAEYRRQPEVYEKELAYSTEYNSRPEVRERERKRMEEKRKDPEFRDKECAYAAERLRTEPEAIRATGRKSALKRRQLMNLLKDRPCYDCGCCFPHEVMEWDHLPGKEKLFCVGPKQKSVSLETCLEEIEKCQLVCSNCHRIRTASRRTAPPEPKTPQQCACRKAYSKRVGLLNLIKQERPCYDCGGMFPPGVTDWDHLPGKEKSFNLAKCGSHTLEACLDEINKCQLVCANCHRIRTSSRKRKSSQVIGQEGVIRA